MKRSLQFKLVLILIMLVVSVMAVMGVYLLNSVAYYYQEIFRKDMRTVFDDEEFMQNLREGAESDAGGSGVMDVLLGYSSRLGLGSGRTAYVLDGRTADVLAGGEGAAAGTINKTANIITALLGEAGSMGNVMADDFFDMAVPLSSGERSYIVYIRDNKTELRSLLWMLLSITLQAMAFGLVLAVLLSVLLSKTISKPIENLTKGAKLVASGQFSDGLPIYSHDEIGTLTQTFNDMAQVLRATLEAVEREKNKLSILFLNMTDGVAAFDRQGSILHMNPAAEKMLGVGFDPGLGFDAVFGGSGVEFSDIFGLEPDKNLAADLSACGRSLKLFFAPFAREDSGGGVITVIHDITEQSKLEEARKEFVANVSHELRTPLTNIKSYSETILDDPALPDEYRGKFLRVIQNEADRMTRIVKDLLTVTRLDYGKMDWHFSPLAPDLLLEDVTEAMSMEASKSGHKLQLSISGSLPLIIADKDRIEQVLVNIISNAIKYTPEGGEIMTSARAQDGSLRIEVRDNGIGIPAKDLPFLFDRFYRVDKARSREKGGTGLGLAIAKDIIELHRGEISVESEPGKGTCVIITLPAANGGGEAK